MEPKKRIWIVGGSTGIGLELVKLCLNNNYLVIASSRNALDNNNLRKLKEEFPKEINLLDIDVSAKESIKYKVKEAWDIYQGLDIWFYNAGAYEAMSMENWDIDKFEQMNEINYLGVVRLMTILFPYFKDSKQSHWIWNCSLSSYFGLPQAGGYSAPKAALVNLAQSINPELELSNIKLQIINHGFVKTRLTDKNKFKMPQLMEAKYTAEKIFEGMNESSSFEIRFPFVLSSFLKFLRFLPYKVSLAITKKMLP